MKGKRKNFGDGKYIPKTSYLTIKTLARRIRPVVTEDGHHFFIKKVGLFNAYLWNPELGGKAYLKSIKDIRTYHTYGYYGLFKPSIAEVLAQIPKDIRHLVGAFEIIKHPETAQDLNDEIAVVNDGFHVATTRLYEVRNVK